ncbi:MAG: serine hydrolase domain-containing protein [Chitinophagaceae bacterium]
MLQPRWLALSIFFLSFNFSLYGQNSEKLPSGIPENEGVSSVGIDRFLNATKNSGNEFHSFMFLRHGKVIAQGWWNPYQPTLKHSLYSVSKSFTSTAIGFAVSENLLTVQDKVISFFPNRLPDHIPPYLAQLTIKDLLTMSAGQDPDPTSTIPFTTDNWVKAFLATPIVNQPGSHFLYNTMAVYMLSAIIQKVTGEKELDYLKPRLFDPLGIKGMDWEVSDEGINTGGWGLRLKTEDMAKFGELYLHNGWWNGKQLLPKEWIKEATTLKIDQAPGLSQSKKDSSDWTQGYCYLFWRCRHDAFRADGAFGQYIIIMPDQDAVIAITCETPDMQGEINLVWKYLLPSMHAKALPLNKAGDLTLIKHLAALSISPLHNLTHDENVLTKNKSFTFSMRPNHLDFKSITFRISNKICHVVLKKGSGTYSLNFESGKWLAGTTDLQGPGLMVHAKEDFAFLKPYKVDCSYGWQSGAQLKLKIRYIESPHSETIICHFSGNKLNASIENSFDFGKKKTELNGELVN